MKIEEAYEHFDNILNKELFIFLKLYENIEDPINYILDDPDLVTLFNIYPALVARVKAYQTIFRPIMGTKEYAGGGCFAAGSLVQMANYCTKPIEKIVIGDTILGYDMNGSECENKVVDCGTTVANIIIINNKIKASVTQPLYLIEEKWIRADELSLGSNLLAQSSQSLLIESLESENYPQTVYWLEVEPYHTYWVDGILAHNKLMH